MINLKDYITKKGNKVTAFNAFNEHLVKDKQVFNKLDNMLKKYSYIDFEEFLKLTEFQYMRAVSKNDKAIKIEGVFDEICMLYSLSDGQVTDITRMDYDKYCKLMEETEKPLVVTCEPFSITAEFGNKKGEGVIISHNDPLSDDIYITTLETVGNKEIKHDFALDKSNGDIEIIRNKQQSSLFRERE